MMTSHKFISICMGPFGGLFLLAHIHRSNTASYLNSITTMTYQCASMATAACLEVKYDLRFEMTAWLTPLVLPRYFAIYVQGPSYLLEQRFGGCFVLKFALQRGEGRKGRECEFQNNAHRTFAPRNTLSPVDKNTSPNSLP